MLVPVLVDRGGGAHPRTALTADATLTPRAHLFGDRVRARVTVALDPRRVDPRSVRIDASFKPFATVGNARVLRGPTSVRLDATLLCLARVCAPGAPQRARAFPPARVRYRDRSGLAHSVTTSWPPLLAASRLTPADVLRPRIRVTSWAPRSSAAVDPTLAGWALTACAAALLVVAGGALARRRRARPAPAAWVPSEVPALESALESVKRLADESDAARRSAIDRLARELERAGLSGLAPEARALAWSPAVPSAQPMHDLSADVLKAVDAA
jgi:hypothetical protein